MTFLSSPDSKWFSVIFVQANSSSCLRGRKPLRPPPYTHMQAQTDDNHAILLLPVLVYISNSSFRGEKEPGSEGTAQKRLLSTHLIITLSTPPFSLLLSFSYYSVSLSKGQTVSYQKIVFRTNAPTTICSGIEAVFIVMDLITFGCPVLQLTQLHLISLC